LHVALGIALPLGLLDISFYRDDFDKTGCIPRLSRQKFRSKSTAAISSWSTTCSTPAAPCAGDERIVRLRAAGFDQPRRADRSRRARVAGRRAICRRQAGHAAGSMLVLDRDENGKLRLKLDA